MVFVVALAWIASTIIVILAAVKTARLLDFERRPIHCRTCDSLSMVVGRRGSYLVEFREVAFRSEFTRWGYRGCNNLPRRFSPFA